MCTLTIKLKQHSPLIHFQHQQQGATLRASEVKPKLDKFLRQKLDPSKDDSSWYVSDSKKAFNYKMRIKCEGDRKEYMLLSRFMNVQGSGKVEIIGPSPFFAQEGNNGNNAVLRRDEWIYHFNEKEWKKIGKQGLMWNEGLTITFFSLNEDVIKQISKYIVEFFICTNFGNRSTKGFGSFTVDVDKTNKIAENTIKLQSIKIQDCFNKNFDIAYRRSTQCRSIKEVLKNIADDTKHLKKYASAYLKTKGLGYRSDIYFLVSKSHNEDPEDSKFVRAMLGLCNNYKIGNLNYRVSSQKIERFPAPIMFKIIGTQIYLLGNKSQLVSEMFNQEFKFSYSDNNNRGQFSLYTPSQNEFDLQEYIEGALHYQSTDNKTNRKSSINYINLKSNRR